MSLSTRHARHHIDVVAGPPPIAARLRTAEQAVNPLLEASRVLLRALADMPDLLDADAVVQWRQWLEQEIRLFTRVCAELRLPPEHVRQASYGLCSALDEAVMRTKWGQAQTAGIEWETNGLAVAFGHDRLGRDRVFEQIDETLCSPRENLDLIELYQNILDLGFRGRYRLEREGRKRLQAIRERVHDAVVTGGLCSQPITETSVPRRTVDPWVRPTVKRRSRVGLVLGLVIGLPCACLMAVGGYVAADHGVRVWHTKQTSLEPLANGLQARLRDQMAAGNVELIRAHGQNALTLRFSGMFSPGEATVAPWAASVVALAGREISASAGKPKVRVTGYADSLPAGSLVRGSNQALSEARARSVAHILEAAGVPVESTAVEGMGDSNPLADNGTLEGRAQNRRVEVTVSN
jgi:type VI secretion system protein ImpK